MKKLLAIPLSICFSFSAHAYKQQTAKIIEFYVNEDGSIALKLESGFSADMIAECPAYNGYAGTRTADNTLKSFILAQYAAGKVVKIGVSGCDGNWMKIVDTRGF